MPPLRKLPWGDDASVSRRHLLRRIGWAASGLGAVALLAACGQSGATATTGSASSAATSASSAAPSTSAASSQAASSAGSSTASSSSAAATSTASGSASTSAASAAASTSATSSGSASVYVTPTPVPVSTNLNGDASKLKKVDRNRTLVLGTDNTNEILDYDEINPFLTASSTSDGYPYANEALYYYNSYHTDSVCGPNGMPCKDGEIPWQATDYAYNSDFTQVTVHLRKGVEWSDGQPFTSKDVAFTVNMLKAHAPTLSWSIDMKEWVKEVQTPDDQTVIFVLNQANPRFFFSYFQFHQDIGVMIQPEHIWKNVDPTTFTNLDVSKGLPITTSPWKCVYSTPQQRIWDRNDNWWAAKTGFHPLPAMERILVIPGNTETKLVEWAISNTTDETLDLRPRNIEAVVKQNPKIETWTLNKPPYGYLDWWPVSLSFNDSKAPYDDPDIRWAINYAIDRNQLVQVGYGGAGSTTLLPYPNFPALLTWLDKIDIKSLLQKYPIDKHDPAMTASIMQSKGWKKDSSGFWAKDGKQFPFIIQISVLFQDITPVLVEQLRKAGFNASYKQQQNEATILALGTEDAFINGHGGSVRDPYFTLRLYQSRFSAPTGQPATYPYRWHNDDFDKLVDQMGVTADDDPKLVGLFKQAMEIWMKNLPDVGLVQWYHRIPTDSTYWTNWPNENNPYINTAFWHRTSPLWINTIKPAQ